MRTKLKTDEKVYLITRPHWFPALFFPMLLSVIFIAVGIAAGLYVHPWLYLIVLAAVIYATIKILERQCNIWAVTNLRVIDESGLLTHYAIESPLDKINNVSFTQTLWGRTMGYGNVMIQTAADHGATTYVGVENPHVLKDTITTMQEEYKKSRANSFEEKFLGALSNTRQKDNTTSYSVELEKIFELKQKGVLTEEEYNKLKAKILNS
jgi:uncharacterized membrane protein YdbT with pleckstrin-like domain